MLMSYVKCFVQTFCETCTKVEMMKCFRRRFDIRSDLLREYKGLIIFNGFQEFEKKKKKKKKNMILFHVSSFDKFSTFY